MIAQVLAATGLSDDPAGRQRALASLEATGVVHPLPSAVRKMVISGGAGPAQVAASEAAAADKFEAEVQAILMAEDADLDDPKARARATALAAERHPELAPLYSPSDVALAELLGGRDRAVRLRELEREMDLRFTRSGDRPHLLSRLYAEMGATTPKDWQ